ncbi:transglycosylase domain-containing protein [Holdemania massiliensis]|uniref:Penicillin-binding protein n=1 Tax=Holdemania massiliensis TaxID=1468449 RepID=A0A6N7S5C2_9FIRM|nr:transglycosylase domain-containing protein [Holdemania massiliensis]MSA70166.1 penicillin-binding protein [Holdemania massiliensis]MSA88845.1 penicillin-binding protein [Holdemania massiliensis]MSB77466.1 penicillin-binding protein [Holdemania massiliensis]MSC32392.1 penicillin-binding protein [Holdemania massiliensis]MSC38712.1 penicillin-binding protein [Holdemania massiliensis]
MSEQNKSMDPQESQNKPKKKKRRGSLGKKIAIFFVYFLLIAGLAVGGGGLYIASEMIKDAPEISLNDFEGLESSQIYDQDGILITELGAYLRENITYEDMPNSLVDAFVAIEDSRYFEHPGFDVPRFAKAALENLKSKSFGQGGSTFTMQLVKNTYFQVDDLENSTIAEKSVDRKVQEIWTALKLEKMIDKKQIFQLYLNKLNFGGNIRGVQKAAQYYFGKDAKDLSLGESALLAGIINRPNAYNPYENLDYATNRRNTVLDMMVYHGYITEMEADLAKSIRVEDLLVGEDYTISESGGPYQAYVDAVIEEVKQITGKDPALTPMKVYTNMDRTVQEQIDAIQKGENIEYPDELMQIAIVSMNNQTGEIRGLGGGRNYSGARLLNRAISQFKQPGSAVKPFLSYALAFEHLGWATDHVITDRPIVYRGTKKVINNFDGQYRGDVTLQQAVGQSLNTPAIQTLQEVIDTIGRSKVVDYLQSLGFSQVNSDNFDTGYAIGGSSFQASATEMASAHAAMVNGGRYVQPHTVSRIEFNDGTADYVADHSGKQVISEEAAYMSSTLMQYCVEGPYFNYMQVLKRSYPVYAKTGTTDWGKDGLRFGIPEGAAKDKWMIASTSQTTNVVWVGYDKGVKDEGTYFNNAKSKLNIPGQICELLLDANYDEADPPKALTRPDGVENITHIIGTFPYASLDGVDPSLSTTGLIKKEYNNLVSPWGNSEQKLESTVSGYIDEWGGLTINWGGYRGDLPANQKEISLSQGDIYVYAVGQKLFDWNWILGNPYYYAKVYLNGNLYHEVSSDQPTYYDWVEGGGSVKVCGYYVYSTGLHSEEQCVTVR